MRKVLRWWDRQSITTTQMRKFHGWATVVWFVAAFPVCIWLNSSLPVLTFLSVYAIVASHWAAWQGSRVEERQDNDDRR